MKKSIFLAFGMLTLFSLKAQKNVEIYKEKSSIINERLGDVDSLIIFENKGTYQLKILTFWYAGVGPVNSRTIVQDFYVRYMEIDSSDNQMEYGHFWIKGKFNQPKNFNFNESSRILSFDYYAGEEKKRKQLKMSPDKIEQLD